MVIPGTTKTITPEDELWERMPPRLKRYVDYCIEESMQKHKVTADMLDIKVILERGRLKMVQIKPKDPNIIRRRKNQLYYDSILWGDPVKSNKVKRAIQAVAEQRGCEIADISIEEMDSIKEQMKGT